MKRIFALFLFLILFIASSVAFASKLPNNELNFLKKEVPGMNMRFDGMVEFPDGTNYIPVFPYQTTNEAVDVKIIQTIPKNKSINDRPDFILFNTKLALFKIKQEKDKKTILYSDEIPYDVKMGIMPQDLLVPQGFIIPEQLRIIIGDLLIPVAPITEYKEVSVTTGKPVKNSPRTKTIIVQKAAQQLNNKYFYSTAFNKPTLNILNSDTAKAFKQIVFSSIPSDIKLTNDGRYLLVSTLRNGKVFVVDTQKTTVLKEIEAGEKPSNIAVSEPEKLAYIANRGEDTITVVNIKTMQKEPDIKVIGNPAYLVLSDDGQKLYYLDAISGIVYYLKKNDDYFQPYSAKQLFRANNISKLQLVGDKLYTFDRGENKLMVYYLNGKPQKEGLVTVSDITSVENTKADLEKPAVDYNYYNDANSESTDGNDSVEGDGNVTKKPTFKQRTISIVRKVLYYEEDDKDVPEKPLNVNNQVRVFDVQKNDEVISVVPADDVAANENNADQEKGKVKPKKTAKQRFHEFLNYKAEVPAEDPIEVIKLNVENQMDFVNVVNRANDFIVIKDKIYVLCSDDYTVLVYDANNYGLLNSFELDRNGYYNAIRVSNDKKVGIITNISSGVMTIFDTEKDSIIQKLPTSVNVHNVVITGRK